MPARKIPPAKKRQLRKKAVLKPKGRMVKTKSSSKVPLKKFTSGFVKDSPRSKKAKKLTPNSNPMTSTNPGNVDPSPSGPVEASRLTKSTYSRMGKLNPYDYQKHLLKEKKQRLGMAALTTSRKVKMNVTKPPQG